MKLVVRQRGAEEWRKNTRICDVVNDGFLGAQQDSRAAEEAAMRESVKQMETGWNTKKQGWVIAAFQNTAVAPRG